MRKYFLSHDLKLCQKVKILYGKGKNIYEIGKIIGYRHSSVSRVLSKMLGKKLRQKEVGSTFVDHGRVIIKTPDGWRRRAVVVMEKKIGKSTEGFDVHHIDGNSLNDHPSNLTLVTRSQHCAITNKVRAKKK